MRRTLPWTLALGWLVGVAVVGGAPLAAQPTQTLIGQRTVGCNYNATLDLVVVDALWTTAVIGARAPAGMVWVVLIIDVTNTSEKQEALTERPLYLIDDRGRAYDTLEDPPDIGDVADAYGVLTPSYEFLPGITARSLVTIPVAADAQSLTLAGKSIYC